MIHKYSIQSLLLNNFRNYSSLGLDFGKKPVVLYGNNGAGKTNLLESISLLFPGRGLRSVSSSELGRNGDKEWSIYSSISDNISINKVGIGHVEGRNITKIDGKIQKSRAYLADVVKILWLTPQMDSIFLQPTIYRRKFFDRIVYLFFSEHALNIVNYDNYKYQRSKLLRESVNDVRWLSSIEISMANFGMKIAKARIETMRMLQHFIDSKYTDFPKFELNISGNIENMICRSEDVESIYIEKLAKSRYKDMMTSRTSIGVHISDLKVKKVQGDVDAKYCSTGEQKLLLISVVLSAVWAMIEYHKKHPILLLDDIVSHLDNDYCKLLISNVLKMDCQVWFSHTDDKIFRDMCSDCQFFCIHDLFST